MAALTTSASAVSVIARVWGAIADFFFSVADAHSCAAQFKALNDLPDKQLAELGLRRHEIGQHVFRDKICM